MKQEYIFKDSPNGWDVHDANEHNVAELVLCLGKNTYFLNFQGYSYDLGVTDPNTAKERVPTVIALLSK